MIAQVTFLSEGLAASTTDQLFQLVRLDVQVKLHLGFVGELLLAVGAGALARLLLAVDLLQEVWVGHDLVEVGVLEFVLVADRWI